MGMGGVGGGAEKAKREKEGVWCRIREKERERCA